MKENFAYFFRGLVVTSFIKLTKKRQNFGFFNKNKFDAIFNINLRYDWI